MKGEYPIRQDIKARNEYPQGGDEQEIPSRRGGEGFEVFQGIAMGSL
ncbi:hypothetical protein NRK67_16770 (plasmid) [Fusobacteria bacterium ZRK30]|nr:hypothetical protein NRK67_16770 [Fusobacteria bacterium ZRK30]